MPSPAVNTFVSTSGQAVQYNQKSWLPPPPNRNVYPFIATFGALKCPAVVTSTPRADGTRPPLPWTKVWFRGAQSRNGTYVETLKNPAIASTYASEKSTFCVDMSFPSNASQVWSAHVTALANANAKSWYVEQVARTRVLSKLSRNKMELGVTLLEMRQTAGFVHQLAKGLVDAFEGIVNLNRTSAQKTERFFRDVVRNGGDFYKAAEKVGLQNTSVLERTRDAWMGYQFGLKPAVKDVSNSVDTLVEYQTQLKTALLVKVKGGYEDSDIRTVKFPGWGLTAPDVYVRFRDSAQVNFSLTYEMPAGGVPLDVLLGLNNAASTGWEVVKLSWMVDYVFGVGDWLRSMTAAQGLLFKEGSKSTLLRSVSDGITGLAPHTRTSMSNIVLDGRPGDYFREAGSFRREVIPPSGVVPGVVPQIKKQLGLTQMGNSLFALSHWLQGGTLVR